MGGSSNINDKIFITCNPVDEAGNIIQEFTVDKDGNFLQNLVNTFGEITDIQSLLMGKNEVSTGIGFFIGFILILITYYIGKYVFQKIALNMVNKTNSIASQKAPPPPARAPSAVPPTSPPSDPVRRASSAPPPPPS